MRVLLISHACAAPINRAKLSALSRRPDLEVSLLVPRLWKEGERRYLTKPGEDEGFRIYAGGVLFSGRVTGHFYRSGLNRALRAERPDIVHLEEEPWSLVAAQVMAELALIRPRPKLVVFSFENMDLNLPWYRDGIERWVLASADALIAGGETVRERLLGRGAAPGRLTVLPQFGLDPDIFRPPAGPERPDIFTVGFVGRHVHEKGVDILIEALARLKGDWRAIIAGDGPTRAELESSAGRHGMGGRIRFTGWLDHFEIPDLLRQMNVLVLPTRTVERYKEQFGHVLIEAMSAGVVPVGSSSGEIPHVIGEDGFIFPENDSAALASILQDLLDRPALLDRLSASGRKRVVSEFGWNVIAEKTHAVYGRALSGENAGCGAQGQ
jgi:glycosyltransferase involved in cell wall biosynthesis